MRLPKQTRRVDRGVQLLEAVAGEKGVQPSPCAPGQEKCVCALSNACCGSGTTCKCFLGAATCQG